MKTYKKTIDSPRLIITLDSETEPRANQYDLLGYFVTFDSNYHSPDNTYYAHEAIVETRDKARDTAHHMELIQQKMEAEKDEKVLAIHPVYQSNWYSRIVYSLDNSLNSSPCGFYIVTEESAEALATPPDNFFKIIREELYKHNAYINGRIYEYTLYDESGKVVQSRRGFYNMDDVHNSIIEADESFLGENLYEYRIDL